MSPKASLLLAAMFAYCLFAPARAHAEEPARVRAARVAHGKAIAALFAQARVQAPAKTLLLRGFKEEGELELWAGEREGAPLKLITTYKICARSGGPGPKGRANDGQVPEGFYKIERLNPWSSYHLSMQVDYPNAADRLRAGQRGITELGGDIFIHGNCVTIGCIPIEDGPIEELYLIAGDAHARGAPIAVHLFPARPDGKPWEALQARATPALREFWNSLKPGYSKFEETHVIPKVTISQTGNYEVQ